MEASLNEITNKLRNFCMSKFKSDYFTMVYGSYAYGTVTSNSDLDFVALSVEFDDGSLTNILGFAFSLYKEFDLAFDDEVPHERKILARYQMLEDAIKGYGFEKKDGRIYVPPVVKTKEFLNSDEIAMRLLLNAITGKNIFVCGNEDYYLKKRNEALENMVGFLFSIDGVNSFTIPEFAQSLIGTPERSGEMYLGYKDKPPVRRYLTETFEKEFKKLTERKILEFDDGRYYLTNREWLNCLTR